MKTFVDTNVLLEQVMRRPKSFMAEELFNVLTDQGMNIYVSFLTMANAAYVLKKNRTKEQLQQILQSIQNYVTVLGCNQRQWKKAVAYDPQRDFEDLLQYQCAKENHCDVIVTFNKRDFAFADDINVQTPDELCQLLNNDYTTTTTT